MDALVSSSSGSLTSRSTESMEIDALSVLENSPPRSITPEETVDVAEMELEFGVENVDEDKNIVVDAPGVTQPILSSLVVEAVDAGVDDDESLVTTPSGSVREKKRKIKENDLGIFQPPVKRPKATKGLRGVLLGVWRDSSEPKDEDKHVIFGFIDIHDRLRTRIYGQNRRKENLVGNAPTGAGGCWVTFERIILDDHLQGLSTAEIKEYVKIQSDTPPGPEADSHEVALKAVVKAKEIAAQLEAASPAPKAVVPKQPREGRQSLGREETPRPRKYVRKVPSFQAVNAAVMQTPKASPFAEGKPHGVLVGFWQDSAEERDEDKHAVFGVLSETDCFRVKVQRITRDGRVVESNFPVGAGALWLHYEKVVLEPHLRDLGRAGVKEYTRIRQREIQQRESDKERKANELRAAAKARSLVASMHVKESDMPPNGNRFTPVRPSPDIPPEIRHSARGEGRMSSRHQQAEAEERARHEKIEAREKQNEITRKEVAAAEEASVQESAKEELKKNLRKLNKVWVGQQVATGQLPPQKFSQQFNPQQQASQLNNQAPVPYQSVYGGQTPGHPSNGVNGMVPTLENEVRFHNGIRYERKQTGHFAGKLVSEAQIFSIDGEDYVEYRVLSKPSF